jgi:hypothetical protein
MRNQEFETTRTALANAFAAAGKELLGYLAITDTAVAAIPDTSPQKYAVAGTLKGILSMAGKMMGEDGKTGLEGLTRYDDQSGACLRDPEGEYVKFADIERLLAAPAQAGDAREDSERLNYIESGHLALDPCEDQDGIRCYEVNEILGDKEDDSKRTLGFGLTPRAAIDAARTAYQDKGGAA